MRAPLHPALEADPELALRARAIFAASVALAVVVATGTLVRSLIQPLPFTALVALIASVGLLALAPVALRLSPWLGPPAALPSLVLVGLPAVVAYVQGGLEVPIAMALPLAPIAGTFFGGTRVGALTLALALAEVAIFAWLHASGHAFPAAPPEGATLSLARANVLALLVVLAAAFAFFFERRRHRHEARLREERERFRLALDASHDGVFDWDAALGETYASEQLVALLERADLGRSRPSDWVEPSDRARVVEALDALASTGAPLELECRLVTKGEPRWFELRALRVSGEGASARVIGAVRDVDARKRADALKDALISTVSHELRTPLTGIQGALRLLGGGAAGPLSERGTQLVELGERNGRRLMRIVDELLDLQRFHSGEMELDVVPLDARHIVDEARAVAEEIGVLERLEVATPPDAIVLADPGRCAQVWLNLIGNARKFAPEGPLRVTSEVRGGHVRFALGDRGPGVPPEMAETVFDAFTQVDATTTRAHGGSGLGLAIVAAIVRASGGDVGVEPGEGGGAVFWFTLPTA